MSAGRTQDDESLADDDNHSNTSSNYAAAGIAVDSYGVKFHVQPAETNEADPLTWREVGRSINKKLMSISVNIFGVIGDTLVGTRMIVRGIGRLPNSIARRIEQGHDKADRAEAQAQDQAEAKPPSESEAAEALARIEEIILRKQAEGCGTRIIDLGNGQEALVFVKPEDLSIVGPLIQKALSSPKKGDSKPPKKPRTPRTRKPKGQN